MGRYTTEVKTRNTGKSVQYIVVNVIHRYTNVVFFLF